MLLHIMKYIKNALATQLDNKGGISVVPLCIIVSITKCNLSLLSM